ncbi:MAG: hypothetical protein WD294_13570 [Phycisphaeraceae bacterium]
MTVVLAIRCADGLVLAADTQITDKDRGMSYPGRKLHPLGKYGAWGGSGARSVLLDYEHHFNDASEAILASDDVGRALQQRALPIMQYHYDHFIENVPGEASAGTPSAYLLAAGYTHDQSWIVEINPNGMVNHYEDIGFHAIGSGAPMAQQAGALLAHFRMVERAVDYGVVAAVRVLSALSQTSPSVGGALDVCRITPEGAKHLSEKELETVHKQAAKWRTIEQQALDSLF